jgi:hypothetical protein
LEPQGVTLDSFEEAGQIEGASSVQVFMLARIGIVLCTLAAIGGLAWYLPRPTPAGSGWKPYNPGGTRAEETPRNVKAKPAARRQREGPVREDTNPGSTPNEVTLFGRVIDLEGKLVAGVEISVRPESSGPIAEARKFGSGEDGTFKLVLPAAWTKVTVFGHARD